PNLSLTDTIIGLSQRLILHTLRLNSRRMLLLRTSNLRLQSLKLPTQLRHLRTRSIPLRLHRIKRLLTSITERSLTRMLSRLSGGRPSRRTLPPLNTLNSFNSLSITIVFRHDKPSPRIA